MSSRVQSSVFDVTPPVTPAQHHVVHADIENRYNVVINPIILHVMYRLREGIYYSDFYRTNSFYFTTAF